MAGTNASHSKYQRGNVCSWDNTTEMARWQNSVSSLSLQMQAPGCSAACCKSGTASEDIEASGCEHER